MNDEKNIQQRVAFYLRVSTEEQAEKYGFDLQFESLKSLLASKGRLDDGRVAMVLAGEQYIYKDDISGTTMLSEREAFARLQEDYINAPEDQKPFDTVAVYKIDRFARRLKVLLDAIDFFTENKIQFISAKESIDTSTPFGKAMLNFLGVIAELELDTIKMRTQAGREEALKKGKFMGRMAPYGYKKDVDNFLVVFEEEAQIVRMIFDKTVSSRLTTQRVADFLTSSRIYTPEASAIMHGKLRGALKKHNSPYFWRAEQVRSILTDEVYLGKLYYGKNKGKKKVPRSEWKLSEREHTPVVDKFTFEKAGKLLSSAKSVANSSRSVGNHKYLLSGLIKCATCSPLGSSEDSFFTWVGDRKKVASGQYAYSYKCTKKNGKKYSDLCKVLPMPEIPINKYVIDLIKKLLDNPKAVFKYQNNLKSVRIAKKQKTSQRETLLKLLNGIPLRLERLREEHELGLIDSIKLKERINKLYKERDGLKTSIRALDEVIAEIAVNDGYIKSLDLFSVKYRSYLDQIDKFPEEVYELLHILIDKIVIYSRPVTENDSIAGRKKDNQLIPSRMEIKLKLPQDFIDDNFMRADAFGVKSANL